MNRILNSYDTCILKKIIKNKKINKYKYKLFNNTYIFIYIYLYLFIFYFFFIIYFNLFKKKKYIYFQN